MPTKSQRYNKALIAAKTALESIGIPFHLHSGTALGAHREKNFIKHDNDIDLAVFSWDVDTYAKVKKIVNVMEKYGFYLQERLGKLTRGFELQFVHDPTDVSLDIFWVYKNSYRGKDYYILHSYFGKCEQYKYKACVWAYRPYQTVEMNFLGNMYNVMPIETLVDAYGDDWRIPKKFGYEQGLDGGYQSLVPDFYQPKDEKKVDKIAFCFLLYDKVIHSKKWVDFFKEDNYTVKSYSIYSHIKQIKDSTQPWLLENTVKPIPTGWCEESLLWAWVKMLKKALQDPKNKYFVLLSGECVPLYGFWETYKKIMSSKKSRINVARHTEVTEETGLLYADQWVLLNRKHAKLLVNLKDTKEGKNWVRTIKKIIKDFCPDELYPINWFVHKIGKISGSDFKKNFNTIPTTFTKWDNIHPHPIKFNTPNMSKYKHDICNSKALFARKFNPKAGRLVKC